MTLTPEGLKRTVADLLDINELDVRSVKVTGYEVEYVRASSELQRARIDLTNPRGL